MRVMGAVFASAFVVAGCGGSASVELEAVPAPRSSFAAGARLSPRYWEIDEQQVFRDFWDTERQEACSFGAGNGNDGQHYCVPPAAQLFPAFSDAACTLRLSLGPSATRYAALYPNDACSAHQAVFELGELTTIHGAFQVSLDGSCVPSPSLADIPERPVLGEVPLDAFVAATEQVEVMRGRIGRLTLLASDGAQQLVTGWDTQRNELSSPTTDMRWGPARTAYLDPNRHEFVDAACSKPVVGEWYHGDVRCFVTAIRTSSAASGFAELGEPLLGEGYQSYQGECQRVQLSDISYFAVGAPIPSPDLEPSHRVQTGSGRVRVLYDAGAPGVPIVPVGWEPLSQVNGSLRSRVSLQDTERDETCTIVDLGGGHGRCLPEATGGVYFADAACSVPLCVRATGAGAPHSCRVSAASLSNPPLDELPVVRAVTGPHWGRIFGRDVAVNGCQEAHPMGSASYDLGDPVPLEEFEPATWHGQPR